MVQEALNKKITYIPPEPLLHPKKRWNAEKCIPLRIAGVLAGAVAWAIVVLYFCKEAIR
jgi:hypothetical protein